MAPRKKVNTSQREVTEIDKEIGRRLRLLRVDRQMSQMELAGVLGISFQQVQKYEKGANRISASRLIDIARKLETSPQELVGWLDKRTITPLMDEETYKLMRAFSRLHEKYKAIVRALINSLIALEQPA